MAAPSVKGVLFDATLEGIRSALRSGRIARAKLEAQLAPEDLAWLDEPIVASAWYPVEAMGRLTEVLAAIVGGPREETLRRLGAGGAEILRQSGIYQQARFEPGSIEGAGAEATRAFARLTASIWPALYNFGTTRTETAGDDTLIHYEGVGALPDALRLTVEGYTEVTASVASNGAATVRGERLAPDRFVTRIRNRREPAGGAERL